MKRSRDEVEAGLADKVLDLRPRLHFRFSKVELLFRLLSSVLPNVKTIECKDADNCDAA
jgi:hypothetical protein